MPGTSTNVLGVEGGVRLAHKGWLEDVATQAVRQEPPLVKIHLFAGCLEVQRHCIQDTKNKNKDLQ